MSIDTAISKATLRAVSEHAVHQSAPPAQPDGPNTAVIATIRGHHAAMAARLDVLTDAVLAQAGAEPAGQYLPARDELHSWYREELLPHAVAEERALYSQAAELDPTRLLICGMLAEHRSLVSLIANLSAASTAVQVAAAAAAAHAVFTVHVSKENDLILPALDQAGIDLAAVLDGMHEILGHAHEAGEDAGCGCGCGCADETQGADQAPMPLQIVTRPADAPAGADLDVRTLAHGARHEIIFGRLDLLAKGQALVIVNDHDPKPLRYQTAAMWPDRFEWNYLEAGPVTWRVAITRVG